MNSDHKATNATYRENYEKVFGKQKDRNGKGKNKNKN